MPRNVIYDTYLGKLVNLVEENPALYDTSSEEYNYNKNIRIENICDRIAKSMDIETFIFR